MDHPAEIYAMSEYRCSLDDRGSKRCGKYEELTMAVATWFPVTLRGIQPSKGEMLPFEPEPRCCGSR